MRLALIGLPLLAVALACNAAPKKRKERRHHATSSIAPARSRTASSKRDVRDFEVIDPDDMIVYVGSQRCAFHLEVRGTFCDLTFAPELYFHSPGDFERNDVATSPGERQSVSRPLGRSARLLERPRNRCRRRGVHREPDEHSSLPIASAIAAANAKSRASPP